MRRLLTFRNPPEVAVLGVPAEQLTAAADDALSAGARILIAITAGFGERSRLGVEAERALAATTEAAGALLLGPNCMGVYDASTELDLAPWFAPHSEMPCGELDIVSQSGNLGSDIGRAAWEGGIGVRRFVSVGNQAGLDVAGVLELIADDWATAVVGLYVEDFRDGRRFARVATAAVRRGAVVLLLAVGRSLPTVEAARSHTGSLVSDDRVIDALCRETGMIRVASPAELVALAGACRSRSPICGRRVAILSDGGGHGVIAAQLAVRAGLEVPRVPLAPKREFVNAHPRQRPRGIPSTSPTRRRTTSEAFPTPQRSCWPPGRTTL